MSAVTDELKSWKDELEAIASGLFATLDFARLEGVGRSYLYEIQDAIDHTNSVCAHLDRTIHEMETEILER